MELGGYFGGDFDSVFGRLPGVVMADLNSDFWQAVTITWACFGMGVAVFHLIPRTTLSVWLSRSLLALCPIVWTCWGVHAVRINQQLASVVAAKRAEGVSDGRLVTVSRRDLVSGKIGRAHV